MTTTQWDSVYGRPPLSRDAVLFGVALALHLPLFLMSFKGIVRSELKKNSFVKIEMRDVAIDRILQKGMFVPPNLPPTVVKPVDLSGLIKADAVRPILPSPVGGQDAVVKNLLPSVISPKLTPSLTVLPGEQAVVVKGDKGKFAMIPGTIQSIDPRISIAGRSPKTVNIPTAPLAQAEPGINLPPYCRHGPCWPLCLRTGRSSKRVPSKSTGMWGPLFPWGTNRWIPPRKRSPSFEPRRAL
jgi:hypothetical protein